MVEGYDDIYRMFIDDDIEATKRVTDNMKRVGNGEVVLIAGGGKVMTDIAARFVGSDRDLEEIIASDYSKKIVENILTSGHLAATEFDNYIFGVTGYSRVTEVQLVRKRLASYMIRSGRTEKNGRRSFDTVLPNNVLMDSVKTNVALDWDNVIIYDKDTATPMEILEKYPDLKDTAALVSIDYLDILKCIEQWYNKGLSLGVKEEDLRYLKPQATEFKAIIMMNAHGLMDWFRIRCCMNAQTEIRDLAHKMLHLVKEVSPDLFEHAGANCRVLGYCPENGRQNPECVGKIPTHEDVMDAWHEVSGK